MRHDTAGLLSKKTSKIRGALLPVGLVLGTVISLSACGVSDNSDQDKTAVEQGKAPMLDAGIWPKIDNPVKQLAETEQKITKLLGQMSVEEKVGQIIQAEIQHVTPADVKKYHLGSVLNGGGSMPNRNKHATLKEWLDMADAFYEASMDTSDGKVAIPIIWGSDAVHGHNNVIGATIFPHNIGLGAARNPKLMREIGQITAREMRVTGIDWTFAPTLAVAQNDRWGRTYESYSEDPAVVKSYAGEMVYGLQGVPGTKQFLDGEHVVATAKHWLGDGGTEGGTDQGNAQVSEQELRDIHGAGYVTALGAGAQTAMASFSSWKGDKMHGHKYLLTDVLKHRMGLDGLVVSDWNGHGQLPGCTNASCAAAVNAGIDLVMVTEEWKAFFENTVAQVKDGTISMGRLDDAVSRILRVKIRAGLFEKGKPSKRGIAAQDGIIGSQAHRDVARQAVRQSLVLMKNNENILPIKPGTTVLIAGDGADHIGKQSGGWTITWQGTGNNNQDFPGGQSIYQGLKQAIEAIGGTVIFKADGNVDRQVDVAIVVYGENPYAESQGDLESLEFEPQEKTGLPILKQLQAKNIPTVSLFLSGRPLWMAPEMNASDAFVAAWLPGSEGQGVADVLVADKNGKARFDFKGKLPFSWPKAPDQDVLNPHHADYDPAFALGYGLTYQDQIHVAALDEAIAKGVNSDQAVMIYKGRTRASWKIFLETDTGRNVLSGAYGATQGDGLKVMTSDKDIQEDALTLEWKQGTSGQVGIYAFAGSSFYDFSVFSRDKAVITLEVKLDQAPEHPVTYDILCGQDCRISYDMTDKLKAQVGKGWQKITLPLADFDGADLSKINAPMIIKSAGPLSLSVANIMLEKADTE